MKSRRSRSRRSSQRGQTFVLIAIFVSVFLIGMLGVATDYTQIWAHRQIAQGAADAACQAGAADIYLNYVNASAWAANGLPDPTWLGTDYTCDTNTTSSPCRYAALNGYSGANVNVSFPSSVPGVSLAGFTVTNPFIQVRITDPVALSFTKVFTATGTVNVAATATCGLNPIHVPIPLVVLHKTASHALYLNGNPTIEILGGPNRSVQVDSTSATAVGFSGVNAIVDLSQAGPNGNGADFGVFGGPAAKPANVILGAAGTYHSPSSPIGDPWATVSAPAAPGTAGTAIPVSLGVNGCPDPNGCVEMTPGNYTGCSTGTISPGATACLMFPFGGSNPKFSAFGNRPNTPTFVPAGTFIKPTNNNPGNYYFATSGGGTTGPLANGSFPAVPPWPQTLGGTVLDGGVTWHNVGILSTTPNTAIFDPGLFYVGAHGLNGSSNSTLRMSTATGDGSEGAMFYFSTSATLAVDSNSGKASACTAATPGNPTPNGCVVSYIQNGTTSSVATGSVPMRALQCPGGDPVPASVSATLNGNILFGPCTGTYGSPDGKNRGFLFFQNRATPANANWGGGGQFLLSGFMYFHFGSAGVDCGTNTSCLNLSGNSGAGAFTLGNTVADMVTLAGTSGFKMILNPFVTFAVLRAQLLQ